jgi:hypothetical protein
MLDINKFCMTAFAVTVVTVGGTTSAHAQHRSFTESKVGAFTIDYITEGGRFDRCAATTSQGSNTLRIAYSKDLKYAISVPGTPANAKKMMIHLGSILEMVNVNNDRRAKRAWAVVSGEIITEMLSLKNEIMIDLDDEQYTWPIGRTNMEDVLVALENCTQTAMGRRP